MAVPKAPDDAELKNIIEKLAQFVARNGASFEAMTKTKQRDNPRFSFLFGGEGYDYYTYRVTTEQVVYDALRYLHEKWNNEAMKIIKKYESFGSFHCHCVLIGMCLMSSIMPFRR